MAQAIPSSIAQARTSQNQQTPVLSNNDKNRTAENSVAAATSTPHDIHPWHHDLFLRAHGPSGPRHPDLQAHRDMYKNDKESKAGRAEELREERSQSSRAMEVNHHNALYHIGTVAAGGFKQEHVESLVHLGTYALGALANYHGLTPDAPHISESEA